MSKLTQAFRSFHKDEDGIEAVQVVMILAIAASVLVVALTVGQEVVDWARKGWNDMKSNKIT